MDIVIDFDGTVVSHNFPEVGNDIGAVPVLKALVANGHKLFLNTMRSNITEEVVIENLMPADTVLRNYLDEAVQWFKDNDIVLSGINEVNPIQKMFTTSPKIYSEYIIDDTALGCPLLYHEEISELPFVDWGKISDMLRIFM